MVKLDNTPDTYAVSAVIKAKAKKIIQGDEKGDLKLHSTVNRQDLLVMFERAGIF